MKKTVTVFCVILCSLSSYSQRYLTDDYLVLDSIIGGIYGTSTDYQSNNQNLLFDLYEPANDTISERPLIIYIHGGGFNSGSRSYPSVQQICRRMANKGYVVANIDYRLDPGFDLFNSTSDRRAMTDAMHDAKQAIRYFKANATTYGIDTAQVFIGGESAGAITSMMASFVNKQSEMAVYPFANPNNPIGSLANSNVGNGVKGTLCLCGLLLDTLAMELPIDPPILWTHGTNDNLIPISLAFNIVLRASNIGLPIIAKAYQGAGHCPWYYGSSNWATYLDSTITDITNFIYPLLNSTNMSVDALSDDNWASIYPNPFESNLYIKLPTNNPISTITIQSMNGSVLRKIKSLPAASQIQLDLSEADPGIYFVLIENRSKRTLKRVVKSW